jgi:hypothetical protein
MLAGTGRSSVYTNARDTSTTIKRRASERNAFSAIVVVDQLTSLLNCRLFKQSISRFQSNRIALTAAPCELFQAQFTPALTPRQ